MVEDKVRFGDFSFDPVTREFACMFVEGFEEGYLGFRIRVGREGGFNDSNFIVDGG